MLYTVATGTVSIVVTQDMYALQPTFCNRVQAHYYVFSNELSG